MCRRRTRGGAAHAGGGPGEGVPKAGAALPAPRLPLGIPRQPRAAAAAAAPLLSLRTALDGLVVLPKPIEHRELVLVVVVPAPASGVARVGGGGLPPERSERVAVVVGPAGVPESVPIDAVRCRLRRTQRLKLPVVDGGRPSAE